MERGTSATMELRARWAPGKRLPAAELPGDGGGVPLRPGGRDATALLVCHGAGCDECRAYVARLADAYTSKLRHWRARVVVVVGGASAASGASADDGSAGPGVVPARDPEHVLAGLAEPDGVALLIADRLGRVFEVTRAPDADGLPSVPAIEEWFRFLAMQCPECGVPDDPGLGRWAPEA
jgi:hypothetical protein